MSQLELNFIEIVKTKICRTCKNKKPISEFYKSASKGYVNYSVECKECYKEIIRNKYCKEELFKQKATRHRISTDELYGLNCIQQNLCAICNREEKFHNQYGKKSLAIDHDHKTNKVRGLLCSNCNRALGLFEDNPEFLQNAINYIIKSRQNDKNK